MYMKLKFLLITQRLRQFRYPEIVVGMNDLIYYEDRQSAQSALEVITNPLHNLAIDLNFINEIDV